MRSDCDIAIVGAGAAGMFAAIFAGRHAPAGTRIVALDGAKKVGAKILVSGGGRCNVTHDAVTPDDYAGSSRNSIARVLRSFSVDDVVAFFAERGVTLKREETGKLFPVTDSARTVLDALLSAMRDTGVDLRTDHRVQSIRAGDSDFAIEMERGMLTTRLLVLATGGRSLPKTGSDGAGYGFAQALGHTVTPTTPALVPLVLGEGHWLTDHSGVTVDLTLTLASASGKVLHRQRGSTLFTHFGLSGPAPMDISRHWIRAHAENPATRLLADFTAGLRFDEVERALSDHAARSPRAAVVNAVTRWMPSKLARALCEREAGVASDTPLGQLPRDDRRALAHALTALRLPVVRDRGYLFAEVTAGGVPLNEVDPATMASRRCPGLYLCGEILDADGRIGGYNFQWAWCTGRLAGIAAARASEGVGVSTGGGAA